MKIAVLLTVYNRKEKTLACLDSLENSLVQKENSKMIVDVFLTDDGCTDGTSKAIGERKYNFIIHLLQGNGYLYWNCGMINSWKTAMKYDDYDGFLWLNNDVVLNTNLWEELIETENFSINHYKQKGIYVGSTYDPNTKKISYGGFDFVSKWTLKDRFIIPNGKNIQSCQCAHGNITYISKEVVEKMGVLYEGHIHGGGDHDYTYRAYKAGFPVLVMKNYVGICENDHMKKRHVDFMRMSLGERIKYMKSPFGLNLHNILLFQKRCFPYRYPFVWLIGYLKALFPILYFKIYRFMRE